MKRFWEGQEMGEIIGESDPYPKGIEPLEERWLDWVKA